jgi:hypothetical protein
MSDAEFIDDRGEAGPEDNAEWLRWAAETYASAVENGGCYSPEPDWDFEAISPRLREAAAEIERLSARVAKLERQRPSSVLGVEPFFDGGQWCAQYCKVAEFGPTPETALDAFDNSALSYAIAGMLEDE